MLCTARPSNEAARGHSTFPQTIPPQWYTTATTTSRTQTTGSFRFSNAGITLSVWCYVTNSTVFSVLCWNSPHYRNGWGAEDSNDGGNLVLKCGKSTSTWSSPNAESSASFASLGLNNNSWFHLAWRFTPDGLGGANWAVNINGVRQNSLTQYTYNWTRDNFNTVNGLFPRIAGSLVSASGTDDPNRTQRLFFGGLSGPRQAEFYIDDFRFLDRPLTDTEMLTLFTS
jgi:hypothetical protein